MPKITGVESVQGAKLSFSSQPSLSFRKGEVVEGKVLQVTSSKTIMIQLKNQVIEAKTEIPLQAGTLARFVVLSIEGEIRLKRLPSLSREEGLLTEALRAAKGSGRSPSEIYRAISQLKNLPEAIQKMLPDLSVLDAFMQGVGALSGEQLKALLASSGLTFENKLKRLILDAESDGTVKSDFRKVLAKQLQSDLKGTLLEVRSRLLVQDFLEQLKHHNINRQTLSEAVEALLSEITAHQLQSKLNHTLQLFLPFIWKGLRDGKMIFKKSGEERSSARVNGQSSCVLHLDLEKAGKMSAQVQMVSGQFHLRLAVEDARFVAVLQERSEALKTQFIDAGLKWGELSVRHQQKIDFDQEMTEGIDIKV